MKSGSISDLAQRINSIKTKILQAKTTNPTGGDSAKLFLRSAFVLAPSGQTGTNATAIYRRWEVYLQDLSDREHGIFFPEPLGGAASYKFDSINWIQPYIVSVYGVLGEPTHFFVEVTVNPDTSPIDQPGIQFFGGDKFEIASVSQI